MPKVSVEIPKVVRPLKFPKRRSPKAEGVSRFVYLRKGCSVSGGNRQRPFKPTGGIGK